MPSLQPLSLGLLGVASMYHYQSSSTRIKLIQKLSAAIDVIIETEQGQPMSPELFKIDIQYP
jgi:hypothetical protein